MKCWAGWTQAGIKIARKNINELRYADDTTLMVVKAIIFPVVMYGCEKTECWRIDVFELWYWKRLLRVPWIARRSNQSILKEISPEYSLEVLMLKLKFQYFGHRIWRSNSFEKTLMLEKIEGRRRSGWRWTVDEMAGWHHRLNGHEFEQTLGDSEGQGSLMCCSPWGLQESDTASQLNINKQCSKSAW